FVFVSAASLSISAVAREAYDPSGYLRRKSSSVLILWLATALSHSACCVMRGSGGGGAGAGLSAGGLTRGGSTGGASESRGEAGGRRAGDASAITSGRGCFFSGDFAGPLGRTSRA